MLKPEWGIGEWNEGNYGNEGESGWECGESWYNCVEPGWGCKESGWECGGIRVGMWGIMVGMCRFRVLDNHLLYLVSQ